jgi:hypothetical protein
MMMITLVGVEEEIKGSVNGKSFEELLFHVNNSSIQYLNKFFPVSRTSLALLLILRMNALLIFFPTRLNRSDNFKSNEI